MPLFHVLALNAKVVISVPYDNLWSQLTGIILEENNLSLTPVEKEVPLLLKDVSSLLIQLFYALPLNVDKGMPFNNCHPKSGTNIGLKRIAYFTTIVQTLFNLRLIQALAQLSCLMTEEQRMELKELFRSSLQTTSNRFHNLSTTLGLIVDHLEHSPLYVNLDGQVSSNATNSSIIIRRLSNRKLKPGLRVT